MPNQRFIIRHENCNGLIFERSRQHNLSFLPGRIGISRNALFMSGYSAEEASEKRGIPWRSDISFIQKPFTARQIRTRAMQALVVQPALAPE
jgi:hypothetical protein